MVPFYNEASIVLVLTDARQAIETFGLTALEAMAGGLPVIVPTVGGIAEMVEDGWNGYKTDVQELETIGQEICRMLSDKETYLHMAGNALRQSAAFDCETTMDKITRTIAN